MRFRFGQVFLVVTGVWLAGVSAAQADPISLNAELCRGYFLVPVTLQREDSALTDEERTLYFIYDTGASASFVDPDSIRRVSNSEVKPGQRANFGSAKSGDLSFRNLRARVRDLDHLSIGLGRSVDGILAYDVYGDMMVTLDYQSGDILLEEGSLPPADGNRIFSTRGPDKRPWINVLLGKKKRRILIDSGSSTTFSIRNIDSYPTQEPPVEVSAAIRLKRLEVRRGARLAADALIGSYLIRTPVIFELPETELLGSGIMQHFRLTFDVRNRKVLFDAYEEDTPITVPSEKGYGLFLKPRPEGFEILKVIKGGPAEGLDLQKGDIITHIGGRPADDRECKATASYETVTLTRRRGDNSADIPLDISKPVIR